MTAAAVVGMTAAAAVWLLGVAVASVDRASVRAALPAGTRLDPGNTEGAADGRAMAWFRGTRIGVLAAGAALIGWTVAGPAGAVAGMAVCVAVPRSRRRRHRQAELVALETGLADAVSAVAGAIRAGRSMSGALEEAASTVPPPLGPRLRTLVDRVTLGVPFEEALPDLAASLPGAEGRLVAAVLGLHQRSGGDAPAVLDRVARTLRDRRATAQEVRSLTAQARLSGAILGFLPIGFFLFLSVTARTDVDRALHSATGMTAIVAGLVMQTAAFVWIRRLLRVEA